MAYKKNFGTVELVFEFLMEGDHAIVYCINFTEARRIKYLLIAESSLDIDDDLPPSPSQHKTLAGNWREFLDLFREFWYKISGFVVNPRFSNEIEEYINSWDDHAPEYVAVKIRKSVQQFHFRYGRHSLKNRWKSRRNREESKLLQQEENPPKEKQSL